MVIQFAVIVMMAASETSPTTCGAKNRVMISVPITPTARPAMLEMTVHTAPRAALCARDMSACMLSCRLHAAQGVVCEQRCERRCHGQSIVGTELAYLRRGAHAGASTTRTPSPRVILTASPSTAGVLGFPVHL